MYQNEKVNCVKFFSELNISDELKQAQKDFVEATQYVQTTNYIWDSMMFYYLVNDIKYFASIHLITDEEVTKLQEDLLQLLDDLEAIASKGKFDTGKDIHIYIQHQFRSHLQLYRDIEFATKPDSYIFYQFDYFKR